MTLADDIRDCLAMLKALQEHHGALMPSGITRVRSCLKRALEAVEKPPESELHG